MKIGIVQPYFLPYIGYFALINAVDKFVYFDDVQYIRRGWVNRNRIKMENTWQYIILPVKRSPLSAKINEVYVVNDKRSIKKLKKSIDHNYQKAVYYNIIKKLIFPYILPSEKISNLNINLTNKICTYLEIKTKKYISSEIPKDNSLKRENKIIEICNKLGCKHYINPVGGVDLYSKKKFQEFQIKLNFLKINKITYSQGKYDFIPNLSIIDVLMWNSKNEVQKMLYNYELI